MGGHGVLDTFFRTRPAAGMYPPQFSTKQLQSDWPQCRLQIKCSSSPRIVLLPVKLLLERGDRTFADVPLALRCTACGKRSARRPFGRRAKQAIQSRAVFAMVSGAVTGNGIGPGLQFSTRITASYKLPPSISMFVMNSIPVSSQLREWAEWLVDITSIGRDGLRWMLDNPHGAAPIEAGFPSVAD